ncbi:MAG: EAL domain-containing protein [Thioalkalivibrio sp.]|nr:EAL domain-containing protein [Thioalkalivibrio sp.]
MSRRQELPPDDPGTKDSASVHDARILLVDDNVANLELLRDMLEEAGYADIRAESDALAALTWLNRNEVDLILLDMRMPVIDGLGFLERLAVHVSGMLPPVVVLTAQTDESTRERALALGAMDFATKPFNHEEILQRSHNLIARHREARSELVRADTLQLVVDERTAELQRLARADPVTGLPNRRAILERIDTFRRADRPTVVCFLILDELDEIARVHGHDVVEHLMRELGSLLTASAAVRPGFVGCWGGSEFVVVHDETTLKSSLEGLAARLLRLLAGEIHVGEVAIQVKGRVGCAHSDDEARLTGEKLVRLAAMALPDGAEEGRVGRYRVSIRERLEERDRLRRAMRQARARDELRLVYQPKIDLASGRIAGAEALLRWHSPSLGTVSPGVFVPAAEETGDIIEIGDWVLDAAIGQLARWRRDGAVDATFSLAVNVSSKQLMREGFDRLLVSRLQQHDVPPAMLNVEVTESGLMHDLVAARDRLMALIEAGVGVSIDDFGTGYSSLAYLKSLPISVLKIDRCFVQDLHRNSMDAEIAQMIVSMAHGLDCLVVAEGVENAEQSERLVAMGCEQAQGYLYSPPVEADALLPLLSRSWPV